MPPPPVSFHTKGRRMVYNESHIVVDQAFVHYIPPVAPGDEGRPLSNLPILFIHGGGLTGAMWEATPDRRPGWAVLASRAPYSRPVYCIDAVDSGRSQRCPDDLRSAPVEYRTAKQMHERFRLAPLENKSTDDQEYQFPLEHLDALVAAQSARRRGHEQYSAEARGIQDAISEIGECEIIAHSNGCSTCISALLDPNTRSKVKRLVLVEPAWALADSTDHLNGVTTLLVWGDHLAGHDMWEPIMEYYRALEGDVMVYDLPKMGVNGNSHFPMHDRNSDEVGHLILKWLQKA